MYIGMNLRLTLIASRTLYYFIIVIYLLTVVDIYFVVVYTGLYYRSKHRALYMDSAPQIQ